MISLFPVAARAEAAQPRLYASSRSTGEASAIDTQALSIGITNVAGLTLTGTKSANTLNGAGEEDTISGQGGNDIAYFKRPVEG